jgi:hypothetical protein
VDTVGNMYAAGHCGTVGTGTDLDYATVKFNSQGSQVWVANYNDPWNGQDYARAIFADDAGNAYVAGYSRGPGSYADYATIKYDSGGNELWVARYDDSSGRQDFATSLTVAATGEIFVTGYSDSDFATVKYSETATPWPTFTPAASRTPTPIPPTPTPWPGPGHSIYYNASEFPGCALPGLEVPAVVLSPLGWESAPASLEGAFHNVPDGNYVLVTQECNLFGCWLNTPVTVAGQDAHVTICLQGPMTPTSTPDPASVGGVAEPPDVAGSTGADGRLNGALALIAGAAGIVVFASGGWYARRRFGRQRR